MGLSTVLPDHVLRLMSKSDRAKLGKAGVTAAEAAQKQEAKSEKALQDQIYALLSIRGVRRIVRSRMDRRTTTPVGTPDFLFCFPLARDISPKHFAVRGVPCAIEAKTTNGELSAEQKKALMEFMGDGWKVCVARSLDDVKTFLNDLISTAAL